VALAKELRDGVGQTRHQCDFFLALALAVGAAHDLQTERRSHVKMVVANLPPKEEKMPGMSQESCSEQAGRVVPIIDRNRCEAKEDCVRVCPYDVFEIRSLGAADRQALSWVGWTKALFHGNRQAYVVAGAQCHACGLCIRACPEGAIKLRGVEAT